MSDSMSQKLTFAIFALITPLFVAEAGDWPYWRGPNYDGVSIANLSSSISREANIQWKAPLPGRGCSTPIAWNDKIILTSEIGEKDGILAFDWNGKELWRTTIGEKTPGRGQRVGSGANSSPVTDGKTIFAYFKSGNFAALDFDGEILWKTNLEDSYGEDKLWWDKGSSPALAAGNVIVAIMQTEGDSLLVSFDKKTGKEVWRTSRDYETAPESGDAYTSPLVIERQGIETIVTWGANHLTGHDARNGNLLWKIDGFNPANEQYWRVIASAAISGDMVVVPYARGAAVAGIDLGTHSGEPKWAWSREGIGSDSATPVATENQVIFLKDGGPNRGRVTSINPLNGETIWESHLPRTAQKYYASPLLAGNTFVAAREDGTVFSAKVGSDGLGEISEYSLFEPIISSPVAIGNKLLIRSDQHLVCFGD